MLVVRADASAAIGLGHVMRCLALAEAWIEGGGEVTFAMTEVPPRIAERIERAGARVVMIGSTAEAAALGARFAVVDGYHLGAADQEVLAASARLLVIDDRGETATRSAALVLNHNAYATPELYAHLGAGPRLLLGSEFALLRREFTAAPRVVPELARRILVSFGGADPANLTPRAIEALAGEDLDVLVVAGAANPRAAELHAPATRRAKMRVVTAVDDMAEQMRWADLAVVAAGTTCWELAASGVPMIAVVVADNQVDVGASVAKLGLGLVFAADISVADLRAAVLGLASDADLRAAMARRGPEVIDGRGAQRVCAALRGGA